jgi:hypothetical protein
MRSAFSYADGASEPIAIVGMSSKFSGDATNTRRLWSMLMEGRSGWTPFPSSRFKQDGVYHPNSEKLNSVRAQGGANPAMCGLLILGLRRRTLKEHISSKRMWAFLTRLSSVIPARHHRYDNQHSKHDSTHSR